MADGLGHIFLPKEELETGLMMIMTRLALELVATAPA